MPSLERDRFQLELPEGWIWVDDETGGGAVSPDRTGVLHISAWPVTDREQLPNLSRMLAGFLTEHVGPILTDTLAHFQVNNAEAVAWQYLEDLEDGTRHRVRVWVVGHERTYAFLSYRAPLDQAQACRAEVDAIISGLLLLP